MVGPHDEAADHSIGGTQRLKLAPPLDGLGLTFNMHRHSAKAFGLLKLAVLVYVVVVLATLVGVVALSRLVARRLTAPLVTLSETASVIALSGLAEGQAPVTGRDEVGRLGIAFNAMLAKVASRTEELAMALEAVTATERMKSDFMANITHELRTPLNSVIGFAGLLKDEVPGPLNAQQAQFATDILASGQQLLALVEGILEMSRLEATGAVLEREPVAISVAIKERMAAHRKAAEARGVTMRLDVAPDAGNAELDPKALRRMLDVLLDNCDQVQPRGRRSRGERAA